MTTNVKIPESYRALARLARKSGWTIQQTQNQHLAWVSPEGAVVHTGGSPTAGYRNVLNSATHLRREGLETWRIGIGRRPKRKLRREPVRRSRGVLESAAGEHRRLLDGPA